MRIKRLIMLSALMLCMSALFLPFTAYAATSDDTTPPTLAVELLDEKLYIVAQDDISGVEAVYIDGHRVNLLVNGIADVILKDYAGNGKQVGIYAVDYSGNRSEIILLDNPYYLPPTPTPTPTPTPPRPTRPPFATTPVSTAPAASAPTSTPEPEPQETESVIPDGSNAFTPDGSGTVTDNATNVDGKEFYTITTADDEVYYLIIDKQRGSENVYFLNAVTESDLMALAKKEDIGDQSVIPMPSPEPTPEPTEAPPEPDPTPEPKADGNSMGTILLVLLAAAAVGGAGYYIKIVKPKKQAAYDESDDDEDDDVDTVEDVENMVDDFEYGDADEEYIADSEYDSAEYLPDDESEDSTEADG